MNEEDSHSLANINMNTTSLTYSVPGLDIGSGNIIYTSISQFLSTITPYDLPLNLVRDALHSNLTLIDFAAKSLQIESGFIVIMTLLVIMAFIPFCSTIAWCCKKRSEDQLYNTEEPINPLMLIDDTLENSIHCQRRASIFIIFLLFLILITCDIALFMTNSQLSKTIDMAPEVIEASIYDTTVFLKNTHTQIKYQLDNGLDIAIENITKDLHDIDVLLGEPIKYEVIAHTGIELAFDSLQSISMELITRIQLLQDSIGKALKISQEAAARMEELQIQLSVLQRQCTFRDRPLCDTLRIRSFEENGIIDALKSLQEDQNIFRMKYLGELESGTQVQNLSNEVAISRSIFGNYPEQLKRDTAIQRNETLDQLKNIKYKTTANAHLLTRTIVSLLDELTGTWESIEPHYKDLQSWEDKFWKMTWAIALLIVWILVFMSLTFCCFLCESRVKAAVIMVTCVIIICVGSFLLMIFGVITMAVGGNTEIFLCQPLFDERNEYEFLGKLFDKPGYVYETEKKHGIIADLLKPKENNKTFVNVKLTTAIMECEQNKPSFKVFQLDAFVDTDTSPKVTKQYESVNNAVNNIRVSEKTLLTLTHSIQKILESMLQTSDLNSTTYRANIAQPTPEKDLATFIDQMQRVALQIQDVATSARMTTLGSRAKRLQASILQPLELLRNEILYHLTALELQRDPWQKQVNQTLIHLRNIQGYLEATAAEICQNQTNIYRKRLKSYLALDKGAVSYSSLGEKTAMCRPLFDIFDANRNFLCRNIVDSINGIWFCAFLSLFCWAIGTPLALNIISLHYRLIAINQVKGSNAHLDGNRNVTWRSGDANSSPRPSPRTPRTPRTPRASSQQQERTRPKAKRPIRQDTVESAGSLRDQDEEYDENQPDSDDIEPPMPSQMRTSRELNRGRSRDLNRERSREISRDRSREMSRERSRDLSRGRSAERGGDGGTTPQDQAPKRTFQDIRREMEMERSGRSTPRYQDQSQTQDTISRRTFQDMRRDTDMERSGRSTPRFQDQQQSQPQEPSTKRTFQDLRREMGIEQPGRSSPESDEPTQPQQTAPRRTFQDVRREMDVGQSGRSTPRIEEPTQSQQTIPRRTFQDIRREMDMEQSGRSTPRFPDQQQSQQQETIPKRTFQDIRREMGVEHSGRSSPGIGESTQSQQSIPRRTFQDIRKEMGIAQSGRGSPEIEETSQPSQSISRRTFQDIRKEMGIQPSDKSTLRVPDAGGRKTFLEIRREMQMDQSSNETINRPRPFRDVKREMSSTDQMNESTSKRTYRDIKKEISSETQRQHQRPYQQQPQYQQREQSMNKQNTSETGQTPRLTYRELRHQLVAESVQPINLPSTDENNNTTGRRTYRELRHEMESDAGIGQNRTYRDFRRDEMDREQNNNEPLRTNRNFKKDYSRDYRERDVDRNRNKEYRAKRLPPPPPAPPPPIPASDSHYMNINSSNKRNTPNPAENEDDSDIELDEMNII
ncbi:prominin-like protein isoform X2 [Condylostylus longicornis]|uniref:prominin-like protein isoform X2 n=1 Tax=Condylostylus longicornis TaxID=2530218 RepID=UPI00244E15F5|nr:prominin-like protein isoform X2 [Condylostylus longicornis]